MHNTYHINRDGGEDETRDDFVKAKPAELFPNQYCETTYEDTSDTAVASHAFPEQGEHDGRTKGSTKASPSIGNHC